MLLESVSSTHPEQSNVVTKAVVRAADRLGVSGSDLGRIVGVSDATVSRMKRGDFLLQAGTKSYEIGLFFVRLFRSLDAIVGGDEKVARAWLANENAALGGRPIERIGTIQGLVDVVAYLDARRAIV